jgi:hypothetical protein
MIQKKPITDNLKYCFIKQLKQDYELSSSAKLVGVMLVDYYIPNKPTFPSIETLSNDCNLSKNTILKSIDELLNKKYISKKLIRRFSSFVNSYDFHSAIVDTSTDMSIDTSVDRSTDSSTDSSTDRSINGIEVSEVSEVIEIKENNIKEIAKQFKIRWNEFATYHKLPTILKDFDDEKIKAFSARLKECGNYENFCTIISENWNNSKFIRGENNAKFVFNLTFILQKKSFNKMMNKEYLDKEYFEEQQ